MGKPFVHLHVHSHYSLLDGAAKISDLVHTAAEFGMPALALTDHGNLFGAFEFYQQARKAGVKPIIGYEAYVATGSRLDKDKQSAKYHHLTILAKNYRGYQNLLKLASAAYLSGFYYKPRIDKELLDKYREGLIVLSGCLASEVCQNLLADKKKEARSTIGYYRELFRDNFFIELQKNKIEEQEHANEGLLSLAKEFQLPLVFTSDIHYLRAEDAKPHDVLLCIQTGARITDQDRFRFQTQEFYMKTAQQMHEEASEFPEAAENTLRIADEVDIQIPLGEYHLPRFTTPQGIPAEEYLRNLCEEGLRVRYGKVEGEIKSRFEYEFDVICRMGFASYFLIVWDFINFARNNGVPVGPGRGSAAGSIVSYALSITSLDPLQYNLIFERFLNQGRKEMPDIDIDFETEGRGKVIEYVRGKYGDNQVAQIITFGTMAARAAIRDVGRVMNVPLPEVDRIAKMVPATPKMTIEKALESDQDFAQLYNSEASAREIIDVARRLEGLNRQPGIHAAGVIITDRDLTEYCPLYKNVDNAITTQYSMDHVSALGLLKMDFLGLNTLTLIQKTLEFIHSARGISVDMANLPLSDPDTYRILSSGETDGVFQLESTGMKELIKKLKPDRFEDVIALVALYRPGPLQSGMVDTYCRCKHGQEKPTYKHPVMEKILEETYGVILYQEQVMQIAKELSGFTLSEADRLRKAMGKKVKEIMDEYRKKFVEGAQQQHQLPPELAGEIFDLIEFFSGYGFNKSHSAAYALVTYQTAYLKARYPLEFMAALMTIESQNTDKIVRYIHTCDNMAIKVLPPDINLSDSPFSVREGSIRFALSAIKGLGDKAVECIISARRQLGKFESIFHFCEHVDTRVINKQVMESLVKSGSMDSFGRSRRELFEVIPAALSMGSSLQKAKSSNQSTFEWEEDALSPNAPGSYDHLYPKVDQWPTGQQAQFEKETLGFYLSQHPVKQWKKYLQMLASHALGDVTMELTAPLLVGGMVSALREMPVKKEGKNQGRKMACARVEDLSGSCPLICFPDVFETQGSALQVDEVVFVRGKLNTRNEEPEIIVDEVIPVVKGIESLPRKIEIHLGSKSEEAIYEVRKVCGQHRGDCKTILELDREEYIVRIEVAEKYYLRPNLQLFQELEKILGENSIILTP